MAYKLLYLPLAAEDIERLAGYLSRFYPHTAGRVLGELETKLAQLSQYPEMYAVSRYDAYYRSFPVERYLVFYHINREQETVEIHRVLRGSWDLPAHLAPHGQEG